MTEMQFNFNTWKSHSYPIIVSCVLVVVTKIHVIQNPLPPCTPPLPTLPSLNITCDFGSRSGFEVMKGLSKVPTSAYRRTYRIIIIGDLLIFSMQKVMHGASLTSSSPLAVSVIFSSKKKSAREVYTLQSRHPEDRL